MITIARFSKPEDAHLLRLRLEAGGVPAYVQDENTVQVIWYCSNAIGGVSVQIPDDSLAAATEIIEENPPANLLDEMQAADWPVCPTCGSSQTAPDEFPRRASFLTVMLAGFPLPISKTRWKCSACARTWNESNRPTQVVY
jgi:hypothetical protein